MSSIRFPRGSIQPLHRKGQDSFLQVRFEWCAAARAFQNPRYFWGSLYVCVACLFLPHSCPFLAFTTVLLLTPRHQAKGAKGAIRCRGPTTVFRQMNLRRHAARKIFVASRIKWIASIRGIDSRWVNLQTRAAAVPPTLSRAWARGKRRGVSPGAAARP